MPAIAFAASDLGPAKSIDAPLGGRLLDLCDEIAAPVSFACRSADCGTCRVAVLRGAGLLASAGPDEMRVLALIGAKPAHRLACQVQVRAGPGRVVLRWIQD